MKASIRIIVACLVAILAFVSCAKQEANDNADSVGGTRTIAVSFANASVKSELNGFQPKFVAGDVIKVSNGTDAPVDCTVEIDGSGNATITTELTGALKMAYPAAAAKMNDNAIDGILVPTVQDGTFASANICKAEIAAGATSATFANQTAVFCITPGAGASTKYVELITAGAEIANSVPAGSEYDTMHKIHVVSTSADAVYISILVPSGLKIRDLSFADGSDMKTLTDDTDEVAVNSLYTVTNANWNRPYVDLQMTVGGKTKTYKWATMNVGATKPEDYGEYFAWGETTGHKANSAKTGFEEGHSFDWAHTPYHTGSSYSTDWTKYIPSDKSSCWSGTGNPDNKLVLDPEDDAARVNWGGSWRMPTKAEFDALIAITDKAWDSVKKGYTFGVSPAQIFLPAAGCGSGTDMDNAGDYGYYWSSSLDIGLPYGAYGIYFNSGYVGTSLSSRSNGRSVRPFSE